MSLVVRRGGEAMGKEEQEKPRRFCKEVAEQVKTTIGKSPDLHQISAIHLFGRTYRVNVYRTLKGDLGMPDKVRITDSYFIVTDDDGTIEKSSPPLVKKYG